jgi:hypothetical protein
VTRNDGTSDTLDFVSTPEFGFYFANPSTMNTTYDVTVTGPDSFILQDNVGTTNTGMFVSISDVTKVPIPDPVWLLGSCVVALLVIKKRRHA